MILPFLVFAQVGVVQLHATVSPDTVYVGQQVSYNGVTFVDDVARARLQVDPAYTPSQMTGVTVYDFPFDTAAITDTTVDGTHFRRYVYHRALFPLTPGAYAVPPSTVQYMLPSGDNALDAPKAYTLSSEPAAFVAIPVPSAGQPLDFAGAVGQFNDTAHTDGSLVRVGDPFVFTVRISGVGNIDLLPRPAIAIDWASTVNGPERVQWDSAGTLVRGAKEFDWVVTPKIVGDVAISAVRFVYFDPSIKRYSIATTSPIPLTVAAAGMTQSVAQQHAEPDTIGDTPFPALMRTLGAHLIVGALVAGIIVICIIVAIVRSVRHPSPE